MPCIRHDHQFRLRPGAVQGPGTAHRADHVIAALHDDAGNVADARHVAQQLVVDLEEAAIDEVVALDAREGRGVVRLFEFRDVGGVQVQEAGGAWQRDWNSEDPRTALISPLPLAVRITLTTTQYAQVQRVIELP